MNVQEILNTIRDNASAEYQARIPEATRTNIESVRYAMLDEDNVQVANEFMNTLLNKLVKSIVHTKMFTNPLKPLKRGTKPIGDTVEEIYNNFIKAEQFDGDIAQRLLSKSLPDTKTLYHRMNYEVQYPITVSRVQLSRAFMSYDALESYITNVINQLYNSAELDEFINMKKLLTSALQNKAMKIVDIADPLASEQNGKEFIKTVKTISGLMTFPSTEYNGYLTAQDKDSKPITTFSRKDEQILILDTATNTSVAVDVLASLFNMSVAEFNDTRKIIIDTFENVEVDGKEYKPYAYLVDDAFFQVFDDLYTVTNWQNPKGLYHNYYLNVWQTQAYSILVNAVAFATPVA